MAHGSVGGRQGWWLCCSGCAAFSLRIKVCMPVLLGCGFGCSSLVLCKSLCLCTLRGVWVFCASLKLVGFTEMEFQSPMHPRGRYEGSWATPPVFPCWGFLWLCFSADCFRLSKPEFNPLDIKVLKRVCMVVCIYTCTWSCVSVCVNTRHVHSFFLITRSSERSSATIV